MSTVSNTVANTHNILDLKKKFVLNLQKANINVPILQARAAIDRSSSMSDLYRNGWVSQVLDLFIGAALKFDDNGELEVGWFGRTFETTPNAVESDGGKYMTTKGRNIQLEGDTRFAPIIESFENWTDLDKPSSTPVAPQKEEGFLALASRKVFGLFGKKESAPATPAPTTATAPAEEQLRAYVGIITDGANTDRNELEMILARTSGNTFYQFIGIGSGVDTPYLSRLANNHDQVGFIHIPDPTKMTPDSFYEALCNPKFAAWI